MPDGKEADVRANQRNQPVTGINVLRWELGSELRTLRLAAGKSIADAARCLECSDAKISRMENGQRGAVARDVRDLCKFYGVPAQRRDQLMTLSREAAAADQATVTTIAARYSTYVALESQARTLRTYEATFVPGLLQTSRYSRAVIAQNGGGDLAEEDVAQRIQIRSDRQRRLWGSDEDLLQAHFIIDENVLWRPAGVNPETRAIREEQIDRLIRATMLPHVTLQIIPYEAGFYQGMEGATINLLNLDEGPRTSSTCYLEGMFMELFVRGHGEIATIGAKFAKMSETALSPTDTRKFLMRLARGNYEHWSSARPSGPSERRKVAMS
ncbi:helix-turn-helix domain-containing protein [Catenulispora pinisilvae]|uniref:helix-turn-helix domain-containing protein n=1 Tax=Catenulispora pinisilvae TaxID=2705253 RepID=UPI001892566A|nr:helix-turn-helix transcriptional regulator [Catenulispora pinisilvae]